MHSFFSRPLVSPATLGGLLTVLGLATSACDPQAETDGDRPETEASVAVESATEGDARLDDSVIPAGGRRASERLAFTAQPSETELRGLAEAGVRVLDLRRPEEERGFDERALAEQVGLDYGNLPVDGAALSDPEVHRAFKDAIEADGELVVHCASGNRVAGLYYAYLVTEQGMSRNEAKERAKELGMTSAGVENGVDAYLDSISGDAGD